MDAIDRQAAIDAIEQHKTAVLGEREWDEGIAYGYAAAHRHLVDIVKQLPSVQPERWIPCSERLPEKDGYYLTTTMYYQVYRDYWNGDNWDRTEMIIAWMPLPEPYKGEQE